MNVPTIPTNLNFEGKIIVKSKLNKTQKNTLKRHKNALDNIIKDMPFDLVIKQSKSKKSLLINADVPDAKAYVIRKRNQKVVKAADLAVYDGKQKLELNNKNINNAIQMLECNKQIFLGIISGNFKEARDNERKLARLAIDDFEAYKSVPSVNITDFPRSLYDRKRINDIKYMIYKIFTLKTPEEKLFAKKQKEYAKELQATHKKPNIIYIPYTGEYF